MAWQRILNERGWAAPHWPSATAADLGPMERLILLDETYRAPPPLPQMFNVGMLGPVLMKFGTPAQCDHFLPRLANLDIWFCQGFSEPGSGSDLASLRTAARREGDHYIVNGQKIWTTTAHLADWVFALVRTDTEARKQEGISFLLIDLRTPASRSGRSTPSTASTISTKSSSTRCACPLATWSARRTRAGIARSSCCRTNARASPTSACAAKRLDYARELAGRYTQAGKPLLDDPKLRADIAMLEAETRALEITNWRFLLTDSEQKRLPAFASVLKLKGTELQQEINALLARIVGPGGLERRSADEVTHGPIAPRYFYSRAQRRSTAARPKCRRTSRPSSDKANMNFELNEDQAALAESLSRLLADRYGFESAVRSPPPAQRMTKRPGLDWPSWA